ncbi:PREDICTED: tripartite motif-containing protein 2-like [Amphimedon queenslandica]|uniref:RING-type domain-containing protein n=1 Tax=Amphimedon queenslandica TaxID=400682 RepID=A0A1X7TZH3_AMPQE|nr:PREDICTED: tripartite motif-containing protein 2-like [Amphimedon queenslandica]|eukprot:XP_011406430.1 PREDICTED: tripartite motif-containing protein 2-like [Amphimedon queenslandica]
MASNELLRSPSTSIASTLTEMLECSVCLDKYKDPRILPCHHAFCKTCIDGLTVQENSLKCPSCREMASLDGITNRSFPPAFTINNLLDLRLDGQEQEDLDLSCPMHKKPLDFFCEKCLDLICTDCVQRSHQGHVCKSVPEAVPKQKSVLQSHSEQVKEEEGFIQSKVEALKERERIVLEQQATVKAEIHTKAIELIRMIQSSEEDLIAKVDEIVQRKLDPLEERRQFLEGTQSEMRNLQEQVSKCLNSSSQQGVLNMAKKLISKMEEVKSSVDKTKMNPTEVADLTFVEDPKCMEAARHLGDLSATFNDQCNVQVISVSCFDKESPQVSVTVSIKYATRPAYAIAPCSSIVCFIQPPNIVRVTESIKGEVSLGDIPNHYVIRFRPNRNGVHKLCLKINEILAKEKPIVVPFNPVFIKRIAPTAYIKNDRMSKPIGLTVSKDKIIVLTDYNELIMLDKNGNNPKVYKQTTNGHHRFSFTRDAAVTPDGCLLMTDKYSILKVSMDGKLLKAIGCRGNGREQFDNPFGITIDEKTGKVYVADLNNHRIQVLNRDYSYSHHFGSRGQAMGQFNQPNGIALDSQGNVFVTDTFNHRIQKFSPDGKCILCFGSEGSNPGQFHLPERIVIRNGYVYITEHKNSRVSVFTTEGKFFKCFGKESSEGKMNWPRGISFDEDGSLYVCDFYLHQIYKY